jgi:CubicO group peptidase (beta-lactamase class C family)
VNQPKVITLSKAKIKIMMSKSNRTIIQTVFLGVFIFNVSYGQTKVDKLDKLISTYSEYGKFNGSVLVAEKGKVIYKKGFGLADMEWNIPNQPDTKYRLGSITKQFTSMLIMQLVEQGKLKLNVPISTYLPDYPKKTETSLRFITCSLTVLEFRI